MDILKASCGEEEVGEEEVGEEGAKII